MNLLGPSGWAHLGPGAEVAAATASGMAMGDVDGNQGQLGVCGMSSKKASNGKERIGEHE